MSRDLHELSMAAASAGLSAKQFSSVELTRACIARAEAVNPTLNCFLGIEADDALAAARRADEARARGEPRGPLHGIPLAHKDALYVRSHYDGITITLPDAPLPDEIAIICAYANRGRPNHRVGGLAAQDIKGLDGLT